MWCCYSCCCCCCCAVAVTAVVVVVVAVVVAAAAAVVAAARLFLLLLCKFAFLSLPACYVAEELNVDMRELELIVGKEASFSPAWDDDLPGQPVAGAECHFLAGKDGEWTTRTKEGCLGKV